MKFKWKNLVCKATKNTVVPPVVILSTVIKLGAQLNHKGVSKIGMLTGRFHYTIHRTLVREVKTLNINVEINGQFGQGHAQTSRSVKVVRAPDRMEIGTPKHKQPLKHLTTVRWMFVFLTMPGLTLGGGEPDAEIATYGLVGTGKHPLFSTGRCINVTVVSVEKIEGALC